MARYSSGRSLTNGVATLPNLSDKIIKSGDQYCEAGAFSDVYKCQYDSGAGLVEVAVKSFRFPFTLGETENDNDNDKSRNVRAQNMIRRELEIWRQLEHPNIVPFLGVAYGFGREGHVSLVCLWMANGPLQRFLGQYGDRLTIAHRLQLLLDIANGLNYLHSFAPTPIIHGNLLSNNVLLDYSYKARLTDFGYSSVIGDIPEASLYLQMTTMRPGTLRWAVPEHFSADVEQTTQLTTQSDIYSFGNLGLLVLTGKPPWSEIQHEAAVVLQLSRGRKPKRPLSRPIEDKHWELIDRCWSLVGHRPCAGDVVSSLQQFRVSSSSTHPAEQNASKPESNVQHRSRSEATLDHQSVMLRDDFSNADVTCGSPQTTGIGKDVMTIYSPKFNPAPIDSNAAAVSEDTHRTSKEEPYASVGSDENYRTNSEQKVQDLDNIAVQQQSRRTGLSISSNRRGGDWLNHRDAKSVGASKGAEYRQIPRSLTVPQPRHVIFMGETGSGKSSIINLFADHNHAAVSPDSRPCTSHFVSYEVSVEARTYRLWDTPALTVTTGSRLLGRFTQTAESSLERFLQKRLDFRELDLFVLCMRGGRVSTETSRIYKMFCRTNRQKAIPVVVAVTHLEEVKPTMDTWWHSHEGELAKRDMVFDGHACLTCLSPHELRGASQQAIRRLISSEYQPRALSALAKEDYLNDPSRRSCTIC